MSINMTIEACFADLTQMFGEHQYEVKFWPCDARWECRLEVYPNDDRQGLITTMKDSTCGGAMNAVVYAARDAEGC